MKVFARYVSLQIPGLVAVLVAVVLLAWLLDVAWWIGALVVVGWVLKDLALYPLLKPAYERTEHLTPRARLIGERGVVERELAPSGYVRLRGELWQAETEDGATLMRGADIVVCAVHGLKLMVRPAPGRSTT